MPVDDCTNTFAQLASNVLPAYMESLRAAMQAPRPLAAFCIPRVGVRSILKHLDRREDFCGCYVLLRDGKPFYVGISRGVIGRLRQHGTGKTHFDASLAYRMACEKLAHDLTRDEAMQDATFRAAFAQAQELLRGCSVAFLEITHPLELYLFEAYCAMALDTGEWNTFRTH